MTEREFIDSIAPIARADMRISGIPASVTIAQACLESAYGTSELAVNARNLFGMKCTLSGNTWTSVWDGVSEYRKRTQEQDQTGKAYYITASFRSYSDVANSIRDHSLYLTQAMNGNRLRYAGLAGERDYRQAAAIIKNGGYATDVKYVDKVCQVIEKWNLTEYDREEKGTMRICLDAGHYGKYNRSPVDKSYYESDMVWKLHLLQKKYLEAYGVEVVLTRESQAVDRGLYDRGAASIGCDLFISDHSNAADKTSVDYPVSYCAINGSADGIALALAQCVETVMGTVQAARIEHRSGSNGDYYGVVRGATAVGTPGLILEHSFHTNPAATAWLLDDSNLDRLARAEADTIAQYYGLQKEKSFGEVFQEGFQLAADGKRWWYQFEDGGYAAAGWYWLTEQTGGTSGWYLFDDAGYMLTGYQTAPDGRKYFLCPEPGIDEGKCMVTDSQGALMVVEWDETKERYKIGI